MGLRYVIAMNKFIKWYTDGSKTLYTLLVKHCNDLLDRQSSERGKDEVTYFYVGDVPNFGNYIKMSPT